MKLACNRLTGAQDTRRFSMTIAMVCEKHQIYDLIEVANCAVDRNADQGESFKKHL